MEDLTKNLKNAQILIKEKDIKTDYYVPSFAKIYPFTTENLKEKYSLFDLKNKKILTILGSGDQILELLLSGATDIDSFDINPLTKFYFELKRGSLLANISKQEYFDFFRFLHYPQFSQNNNQCFNLETYQKILPFLKVEDSSFWTTLFHAYLPNQIRHAGNLFSKDEYGEKTLKKILKYQEEKNFDDLKRKILSLKFQFIHSNITNLSSKLINSYDFIDFSNIIRYVDQMWNKQSLLEFRKVIESFLPYLKEEGNMIVGYIYDYQAEVKEYEIYNHQIRDFVFPKSEYQYYEFQGIYDIQFAPQKKASDALLVYQKKPRGL